jgi:hypothetical protein
MFLDGFLGIGRFCSAASADCVVCSKNISLLASIADSRLCPRLIFSVLFPPFNFIVTSLTDMNIWRTQNSFCRLGLGVVTKGKLILVGRCVSFLFLGFWGALGRWRHLASCCERYGTSCRETFPKLLQVVSRVHAFTTNTAVIAFLITLRDNGNKLPLPDGNFASSFGGCRRAKVGAKPDQTSSIQ